MPLAALLLMLLVAVVSESEVGGTAVCLAEQVQEEVEVVEQVLAAASAISATSSSTKHHTSSRHALVPAAGIECDGKRTSLGLAHVSANVSVSGGSRRGGQAIGSARSVATETHKMASSRNHSLNAANNHGTIHATASRDATHRNARRRVREHRRSAGGDQRAAAIESVIVFVCLDAPPRMSFVVEVVVWVIGGGTGAMVANENESENEDEKVAELVPQERHHPKPEMPNSRETRALAPRADHANRAQCAR